MTTTGAWMAYGLVISGLLTIAALLAERAARNAGRSTRGWWVLAIAGSLLIPLIAYLWPAASPRAAADPGFVLRLQPVTIGPSAEGGAEPGSLLLVAWLMASVLILGVIALSVLRLRMLRRGWREAELDGESVLLSGDVGPAVVGLRRTRIVMPGWVLGIDRELRRLLLLHEREHMRARDPLLLVAGLAALVVAPWNPFVWIQFFRLRLAIELDCDARVLRASGDARGYGTLLIEVGRQRSGGAALALAFGEPRSFLEERIRMLPRVLGRRRLVRAGGLAIGAAFVLLLAVCARDPMSSVNPVEQAGVMSTDATAGDRSDEALMEEPTFTPFTSRPELVNRTEVAKALEANYPPLLRDAGIGGEALVWFFIDRTGTVARAAINRSAGYPALDSAALDVARMMQFTPAKNQAEPVSVWVAIPIVFKASPGEGGGDVRMRRPAGNDTLRSLPGTDPMDRTRARRAPAGSTAPKTLTELETAPTLTPFDTRPELTNRAEIGRLLEANYPPLLRDAGISGETLMWFLIAENGAVMQLRIDRSSGHEALDRAAMDVARNMKFTPAMRDGEAVPVWIAIPIVFNTR
ncbi:MAG: M56 family metallopeptidase [Longimicrobiales bacterium]